MQPLFDQLFLVANHLFKLLNAPLLIGNHRFQFGDLVSDNRRRTWRVATPCSASCIFGWITSQSDAILRGRILIKYES